MEKPAARGVIEEASQKVQTKLERTAEGCSSSTAAQRQHPQHAGRQTVGGREGLDLRCRNRREVQRSSAHMKLPVSGPKEKRLQSLLLLPVEKQQWGRPPRTGRGQALSGKLG